MHRNNHSQSRVCDVERGAGLDDNVRSSQARWFRQFQNCSLHECRSSEPVSTDVRAVEDLWVS